MIAERRFPERLIVDGTDPPTRAPVALATSKSLIDNSKIGVAACCPLQQGIESRAQRLSPFRQAVLDFWRYLVVHEPPNDSIFFHLAKLLDQHFLRDSWNRPLKIGKPQHLPSEQME